MFQPINISFLGKYTLHHLENWRSVIFLHLLSVVFAFFYVPCLFRNLAIMPLLNSLYFVAPLKKFVFLLSLVKPVLLSFYSSSQKHCFSHSLLPSICPHRNHIYQATFHQYISQNSKSLFMMLNISVRFVSIFIITSLLLTCSVNTSLASECRNCHYDEHTVLFVSLTEFFLFLCVVFIHGVGDKYLFEN